MDEICKDDWTKNWLGNYFFGMYGHSQLILCLAMTVVRRQSLGEHWIDINNNKL